MGERYPDNVTIRIMKTADIAACAAIVGETPLWRERYGISTGRAETLFESAMERNDGLLVADANGEVIGFAWFLARGAFGRSGYLRLIGVRSDHRNSRAGGALLNAVESAVGDDLFVLVSDFNTDARRFYERHGYNVIGMLPGYLLPDVTEVLLWRRK
jgi:ribosomal protein S18 acetylase RimI-like enzyme